MNVYNNYGYFGELLEGSVKVYILTWVLTRSNTIILYGVTVNGVQQVCCRILSSVMKNAELYSRTFLLRFSYSLFFAILYEGKFITGENVHCCMTLICFFPITSSEFILKERNFRNAKIYHR